LNRSDEFLAVVLSILIVTGAYGAPTPNVHNSNVFVYASYGSEYADVPSAYTLETNRISEAYNSHLANIADELLKPPVDSANLPNGARSLPPVPGALFMVLAGFVCVSLVKDRRLWIAALASFLWAGQAGFTALPQLASNLASKKQIGQQLPPNVTYASELENLDRPRSDIEGTRYIGLLHHLAGIPDGIMSFLPRISVRDDTQYAIRDTNKVPQFAIKHFSPLLNCPAIYLASRVKQSGCFSPAFNFDNLARGPPEIGLKCRFSSISI